MNPEDTCENRALGLSDLEMCPKDALALLAAQARGSLFNLMEYLDNPATPQRGEFTPVNSFQS